MLINKIFINNTTQLSLSERFTILQRLRPTLPARRLGLDPFTHSNGVMHNHNGLYSSRRGLTPVAQAALALRKIPLKQRIGKINKLAIRRPNIRSLNRIHPMSSSPVPWSGVRSGFYAPRQRARGSSRYRTSSLGQFDRGRSLSINSFNGGRRQSLSRSNSFGNLSQFGSESNQSYPRGWRQQGRGSFRNNNRGRGTWRGGGVPTRGGRGGRDGRGAVTRDQRDRGRGRGRGRGWSRSSSNQKPVSREELDRQLDQYMAGSRNQLDKELDSYMNTISVMEID